MLGVIFWEVLGLFVLGITLYLLAVAKPGTVIDNDGISLLSAPGTAASGICPWHRQTAPAPILPSAGRSW